MDSSDVTVVLPVWDDYVAEHARLDRFRRLIALAELSWVRYP